MTTIEITTTAASPPPLTGTNALLSTQALKPSGESLHFFPCFLGV